MPRSDCLNCLIGASLQVRSHLPCKCIICQLTLFLRLASAVFDGHAGAYVSAHCAQNLLNTILQTDKFRQHAIASQNSEAKSNGDASVATAEQSAPAAATAEGDSQPATADDSAPDSCREAALQNIKAKIRDGFLELDEKMKTLPEVESGEDISGSTAVSTLISPTHFFFANCGDSRGVLSRAGQNVFSTQDHKPVNPAEKERIQRAGGSVMIQRVNGSLAVSRALGDYQYKQVRLSHVVGSFIIA